MKNFVKVSIAAAALAGATLLGGAPAKADGFAIGVGPNGGINFSYSSGGYCDDYGCPDTFWDMPVYYCPVFYRGGWYRGPVYYRHYRGRTQYWVRGGWRYDEWRRGSRPSWACIDRFGPALGFEYYDRHGFRMRDEWRDRWRSHRGPVPPRDVRPPFFGPGPGDHHRRPGPQQSDFGPGSHNPPPLRPSNFGPGPDRHFNSGMRRDAPHPPAMGPQGGPPPNAGNPQGGPRQDVKPDRGNGGSDRHGDRPKDRNDRGPWHP